MAPPKPPRRRRRRSLANVAILDVEGLMRPGLHLFPREVALAFGDGRHNLAWLVRPDADWGTKLPSQDLEVGYGLPPSLVATEIAVALKGCKVYAGLHLLADKWLRSLFAAGEIDEFIEVRWFEELLVRQSLDEPLINELIVERAIRASNARVPGRERAAAQAARLMAFVTEIAPHV